MSNHAPPRPNYGMGLAFVLGFAIGVLTYLSLNLGLCG